jgi:signal transduction histidine kinase
LGRNFEEVLVGHDTDEGLQALAAAIREQRNTSVNLHLKLDDGRELHTKVTLSLVMSIHQDLTHFVGIISDVTAHIQAEQAIAQRSAQLDTIFSLSPDGFVLFDEREQLMFANPAFERMTGRSWKSETEFMSLETFESELGRLCHHDHPMGLIAQWGEDGDPSHSRLQLARPQHRVVRGELRRNMVGRGETILYFRDITHEDEVDRMKSEFLASAAHELRTPMVSIFGFTELLLRRKYKEDRQADMLQTIHRQSGLLVKMINELLDLARIESRRGMDLLIEAHPLRQLVDHSVKGLMRKDTDRQVTLLDIPEVQVLMDPEKMQLALSNLLSNAFKYSPQGGEVTLGARLLVEQGKHMVVLEVQDQGIGMKPDQVARAFERFYRADASGNIPGTGLGLSLVKEIAELHNGRAELQSEAGQGTLARLYLPVDDSSITLTLVA